MFFEIIRHGYGAGDTSHCDLKTHKSWKKCHQNPEPHQLTYTYLLTQGPHLTKEGHFAV